MNAQRFLWLYDRIEEQAAQEDQMSGMEIAVLFILLARDEAGLKAINKADIGALVGVSERHATTILRGLEGKLIKATKGEKAGRGRAPNRYVFRPDSMGSAIPDDWIANPKSGTAIHEKNDKTAGGKALTEESTSPNSGTGVPPNCGEQEASVYRHASARAETPITITLSENNPETPESSGERGAQAREMPEFAGDLDLDWRLGAKHRDFAGERGFLNGSCDELFGQFLDHCATKGPQVSPRWGAEWRKFVRRGVEFAARHKASHESTHDQPSRASNADGSTNVRRKRDPVFDTIFGREAEDAPPLDYGRVDFNASK